MQALAVVGQVSMLAFKAVGSDPVVLLLCAFSASVACMHMLAGRLACASASSDASPTLCLKSCYL